MTSETNRCRIQEKTVGRSVRAVQLENELLAATVLVDKGADIYELIFKPQNIDVLWKSPWGLVEPVQHLISVFDSEAAWLEAYPGGWQEIFPSGGGPCRYKGVELNFHGEASMRPWEYEIVQDGGPAVEMRCTTRLHRSPFRMVRTMIVESGCPMLTIRERITNEGGQEMDYMWGHHPVFGAPFISGACRIDAGACRLQADDQYDGPFNPLQQAQTYSWPTVEHNGKTTDLSRVPDSSASRQLFAYLLDFASGWYAITNTELGFGVGMSWPTAIFPYAWFWQEMNASSGFPWYKNSYIMAVEPFSSIPGQGLVAAMAKTDTTRSLAPGASVEAEMRMVFYESTGRVKTIESDGTVIKER